ncbi:hypothetical protein GGF46_003391 [Coemansia sp. RSA 552]|nr:hypothetical protein GGF46_003391 [Coemansia sp. RSA 552]
MDDLAGVRALVEQAVAAVVQLGVVDQRPLPVAAVMQAAEALRAAEGRDIEYTLHQYVFDLATHAEPDNDRRALAAVDIAIALSGESVVDAAFAFTLLEELLEMVSVAEAGLIFAHMEQRGTELRGGTAATGGKGIVMLRMCNQLLRRIPRSSPEMTALAGRVQVFVGNSLALTERSGVNLRGDFDTAHVATADDGDAEHRAFWALQGFCAAPRKLTEEFAEFVEAATKTLDAFRRTATSRAPRLVVEPTGREALQYVTAPSVQGLQFGDAQFKCQILLQLLILAKYALSMSGAHVQKLRETATNKFFVRELSLTDAQQTKLADLRRRASNQLASAANDRGMFSRTAQFIVFHEAGWARWKATGCRPFEVPPLDALVAEMQEAAMAFLQIQETPYPAAATPMGSERLAELWRVQVAPEDLRGLGDMVRGADLLAAMRNLDLFCRDDSDYDLLTASEQVRADVLQWRALRSSVHDNMFRKLDPTSRSLASLRDEVLPTES